MSDQNEYENLWAEVEEYLSKLNIPNPSEEVKKSLDLMKKQLEQKIDSYIEDEQIKLDSLNPLFQKLNDDVKKYDIEKKEEIGKIPGISAKEMEEQEQMWESFCNNINSTKEKMKKSVEKFSKNIEKWKKIKDKIT